MKKSNKVSLIYIMTSISLLLVLLGGGIYGVYLSIGLNFVKSSISNIAGGGEVGGAVNVADTTAPAAAPSMTGVIILSIALIVLAIFDFVSLIRQITFFKQFKAVSESKITEKIEKKTKSRGMTIFFAILVDLLSVAAGITGIFINMRSFVGNNMAWVLYTIDGLVSLLAVASFVLLIIKLKNRKKFDEDNEPDSSEDDDNNFDEDNLDEDSDMQDDKSEDNDNDFEESKNIISDVFDIDKMEYNLLKLKNLKSSKVITAEEYQRLHSILLGEVNVKENIDNKNQN